MTQAVEVNVSLDRGLPQADILEGMAAAGFHVGRVLGRLHVVSGNISQENLAALAKVKGVRSVELERSVFPSQQSRHPSGQAHRK